MARPVQVAWTVALPWLPGTLAADVPVRIPVSAVQRVPVDDYRNDPIPDVVRTANIVAAPLVTPVSETKSPDARPCGGTLSRKRSSAPGFVTETTE